MKLGDVKGVADLPDVSKQELIDLITELASNLSMEGNWQFDGANLVLPSPSRTDEIIRENIRKMNVAGWL